MMDKSLFLSLILVGLLLTGCSKQIADYNYKITVEIETPEGLVSGSAVRHVQCGDASDSWIPAQKGASCKVYGEGVAIEVPGGVTLFSLLSESSGYIAQSAIIDPEWKPLEPINGLLESVEIVAASKGKTFTLPKTRRTSGFNRKENLKEISNYPTFVRFGDVGDPNSVEIVDIDGLDKVLEPGTQISRITISVTDEPITKEIGDQLQWLGKYPESRLIESPANRESPTFAQTLTHGNFRRGIE